MSLGNHPDRPRRLVDQREQEKTAPSRLVTFVGAIVDILPLVVKRPSRPPAPAAEPLLNLAQMIEVMDNLAAEYITQPQFATYVYGRSLLPRDHWLCQPIHPPNS